MTSLYVYAVLGDAPRALGTGLAGERLRAVRCVDLLLAIGDVAGPPALAPDTLRAHDAVVRRLATHVRAVLPARFGSVVPDEHRLAEVLALRATELREALALVEDREQMTLRVYGESAGVVESPPRGDDSLGPGGQYLTGRLVAHRRERDVPEIERLRASLEPLIAAERVERHRVPPLIASVHHLIPRGRSAAYLETVAAEGVEASVRVVASGPSPAYAFAPEAHA